MGDAFGGKLGLVLERIALAASVGAWVRDALSGLLLHLGFEELEHRHGVVFRFEVDGEARGFVIDERADM